MSLDKLLGIGAIGLGLMLPLLDNLPAIADLPNPVKIIAQAEEQPQIVLNLAVAKKAIKAKVNGKQEVTWQELADGSSVAPGDVLRYTIVGENTGQNPANNLEVTQPIPEQMVYKLDSATAKTQANITYSVDQGKTFVAEPKIKVKQEDGTMTEVPAPPEAYTHIRWNFATVTPEAGAIAMYKVKVQ